MGGSGSSRDGRAERRRPAARRRPGSADARRGAMGALADQNLSADGRRQVIASFIKGIEPQFNPQKRPPQVIPLAGQNPARLSPRQRQTLQRLLSGDSEKQIARQLGVSKNTVHVYVKALYRQYEVNSRGELLARFITSADGFTPG